MVCEYRAHPVPHYYSTECDEVFSVATYGGYEEARLACEAADEICAARKPSKLTIYAKPISGVAPLSVVVDGYLYDADTMSPLAGRRVNLYQDGAYVGYKVTARNGYYRFDVELEVGTYDFYTEFEGDAKYEGCERRW